MNTTPEAVSTKGSLHESCPSCGAQSTVAERSAAGNAAKCPVCGTEMTASDSEIDLTPPGPETEATLSTPGPRSTRRVLRTEDILLERLSKEPTIREQIPLGRSIGIMMLIAVVGFGTYFFTREEEKFGPEQPQAEQQHMHNAADSSAIMAMRLKAQFTVDSLDRYIASHPDDSKAQLTLANTYYDAELWREARTNYEVYLKREPKDVNARVDYAFSLAQSDQNIDAALEQMDKALEYDPNHLNALFNAGIMSLRKLESGDHAAAIKRARGYFMKARSVAVNESPEMVPQIDKLLSEMEKAGQKPAQSPGDGHDEGHTGAMPK